MAFSAKRRRRVARATDHTEKKSLACGNNGKYGKYGIHFQRSAVTMRGTRVRPCVTAGRHSKDFDQLSRHGRSSETMIILRTSAVFTVAVLLLTLKSYAQPIEVRPGEVVQFQLCFYWENLPGSPPASNLDVSLQPDVFAMSGYHWHHDSARPKWTIQPSSFRTSGDGCSPRAPVLCPGSGRNAPNRDLRSRHYLQSRVLGGGLGKQRNLLRAALREPRSLLQAITSRGALSRNIQTGMVSMYPFRRLQKCKQSRNSTGSKLVRNCM